MTVSLLCGNGGGKCSCNPEWGSTREQAQPRCMRNAISFAVVIKHFAARAKTFFFSDLTFKTFVLNTLGNIISLQ